MSEYPYLTARPADVLDRADMPLPAPAQRRELGCRLRIAMLGTRGVPARYGGFETCLEEIGPRLAARGHDVVVYCRSARRSAEELSTYRGMRLVQLPAIRHRALETFSHTGLSVGHLLASRGEADVAFVFNSANAPFLPLLRARRIPVATHVDGLEWKRAKWSDTGKAYYRVAESMAVRWSDALIADAAGIVDYYRDEFGAATVPISYGTSKGSPEAVRRISEYGLAAGGYHLVVARLEPENHVDMIVDGYVRSNARLPLVVVGSAPYSRGYGALIESLANERVQLLGAVWDSELLNGLYAGSATYLHGHSVGGTNPSLLRAMGAGAPTLAFDVNFNREVLGSAGEYFSTASDVGRLLEAAEADPVGSRARGARGARDSERYDWDDITVKYERLALALPGLRAGGDRPSGRRTGTTLR